MREKRHGSARCLPREARLPVTRLQLSALPSGASPIWLAVRVRLHGWRMAWGVSVHIGCGGVAATGQRNLRTLGGGTRHCKTLRVCPTWHSKFRWEDQPASICQSAGVRVESWVWYCRSGGRRHWLEVRFVRKLPKAMIGLGTGGPGKIGSSDSGSKEGCGNLRRLSVSRSWLVWRFVSTRLHCGVIS